MPDANRLPPLGWPWDQMADALLRWDDADKRFNAAMIAADLDARERAALDREIAAADLYAIKREVANQFLLGFRLAMELEPTAVAGLLGDLPPGTITTNALDELEDRVDAVEDAVVNLEQGSVAR